MFSLVYLIDIPFFKPNEKDEEQCEETHDLQEELQKIKEKNLLYSIILDRYKENLEEKEEKSISALKYLINPENKFIRSKIEEFKKEVQEYSIEKAISKSIEYIKSIKTIRWPISFWLSFEDMDKYKIGDDMDKCLLLCSLFKNLKIESKILIDEDKHPYLLYLLNNELVLLECDEGEIKRGTEREILNSKTFIYSFNDKEYEDLTEKEISL